MGPRQPAAEEVFSLRYSPKALLYDIPVTYLEAEFSNGLSSGKEHSPAATRRSKSS